MNLDETRLSPDPPEAPSPSFSVVLPVYNEEDGIEGVIQEALDALARTTWKHELIVINDGSSDRTGDILTRLRQGAGGRLRVITLARNTGQSAALAVGFRAARHDVIVTMDGDGQNDPADIVRLVAELNDCDCCCGYRAHRRDTWSKRLGSRIANRFRNAVLHETVIDTGCGIKAFRAWLAQGLTVWNGMHRFLPALFAMRGARIRQIPVNHRPRAAGTSKYTNFGRLKKTIWDLYGVRWMQQRAVDLNAAQPREESV